MKAVFWQDAQDLVVPLPLDHQVWREEKNARASRLALCCDHQAKAWGSDQSEYRLYGKWKMKSAGAVGYYIYKRSLEQSLLGETDLTVMPLEKWLVRESKTGIAHDWKTNQAKEGMLYSLDLFRFRESSETAIAVFANDSADFSNVPLVSLGAKQRPWGLEVVQEDLTFAVTAEELIASIEETRVARIILLTPAVWRYGS